MYEKQTEVTVVEKSWQVTFTPTFYFLAYFLITSAVDVVNKMELRIVCRGQKHNNKIAGLLEKRITELGVTVASNKA